MGPPRDPTLPGEPAVIVAGILKGNRRAEVDGIVAHFAEGQVPIIGHHLGRTIGYVRALLADDLDVWYVGNVEDQGVTDRLRGRPVAISMELLSVGAPPASDAGTTVRGVAALAQVYRGGRLHEGYTLTAIAVLAEGDTAARPGSTMWAVAP